MKKILTVLGACPQFIKASVVSAAIAAHSDLQEIVVHTGQHFDANMSEVFFQELGMTQPQHNLDIHGGRHGDMTGRMLITLESVVLAEQPDVVLVYGDTNSTLAGALVDARVGASVEQALNEALSAPRQNVQPYGDGTAAQSIVNAIA